MLAPFAQALAVNYLVKCLQQHALEPTSLCTLSLCTAPSSNRGSSWLQRKVSNNLRKGRFGPRCKWHSVLTATCCWFSLPHSKRPQTPLFFQPCTSHHLHRTTVVHCNLFSAFICCQHHSSWELCFVCPACLFFFFKAWAVLSWCTVLCICAQNPTASTAGWVYSGPEAVHCCTNCSSDRHGTVYTSRKSY